MSKAIVFIAIVFVLIGVACPGSAQVSKKPNIIFILADDLGYFDLGCYGNPYNQTPNIDRLSREGLKFTQAYVASPVCSPSRAAILTAKHPARLHLTNFLVGNRMDSTSSVLPAPWKPYLAGSEVTLAELLREQGYRTGVVGKWHLGYADTTMAAAQGFDYDRIIGKNGLDYYNYGITSKNKMIFEDCGRYYLTDKLTDYAVSFVEESDGRPFLLYMAYSAPHVLIVPKGEKLRRYMFAYNRYEEKYNPYYAAMLESLDEGVGRILDALERGGYLENSIVVFTSDNGGVGLPELGPTPTTMDPLRAWKGHVYEGGIRVPLIVRWPGHIEPGTTTDNVITGTDYLPTFMDVLGVKANPQDGKSFLSTLLHPGQYQDRGPVYWHYPHFSNQLGRPAGAVRVGDFKLVQSYETGAVELYNLKEDLSESSDLATRLPAKRDELKRMLEAWRREVNANMPIPNPAHGVKPRR